MSSSSLVTREIAYDDAGLVGLQIGRTFKPATDSLFRARMWNGTTETEVDQDDFQVTQTEIDADTILFTAVYGAVAGITLRLYVKRVSLGFDFWWEKDTDSSTASVMRVDWPVYSLEPVGDPVNCFGMTGGYGGSAVWKPWTADGNSVYFARSPEDLPVVAMWDSESKAVIMSWCDDEEGHALHGHMEGLGTATRFYWSHDVDRRYVPGSAFKKKYRIHLEAFTGLSLNGDLCCDDVAARLRLWMAHPSRPWTALGYWSKRPDISNTIKNLGLLFVFGDPTRADYANSQAEVLNLRTHLQSGSPSVPLNAGIVFHYNWGAIPLAQQSPDVFGGAALPAGVISMADALQAVGIHFQIYTSIINWKNSGLAGNAFDPNNYVVDIDDPFFGPVLPIFQWTFTELRNFAMRDRLGAVKLSSGNSDFRLDVSRSEMPYIFYEAIERYCAAFTGSTKPHALYLDTMPGEFDTTRYQDDPARTAWNNVDHFKGALNILKIVRNLAREAFYKEMTISCEYPCRLLIPAMDYAYTFAESPSPGVPPTRLMDFCLGDYVRLLDARTTFLNGLENDARTVYPIIQMIGEQWLYNGVVQFVNRVNTGPLVPATVDGSHTLDPVWDWCKVLHRAKPYLSKYFEGRGLRDPGGTCVTMRPALLRQRDRSQLFWMFYEGGDYHVQAVARKAQDGDVAVILLNTYKNTLTPPFHTAPATEAQTVTVVVDTLAHDLPVGTKKLYSLDLATGVRTLLTTFTHRVEVTRTIPAFSAAALEVSLS